MASLLSKQFFSLVLTFALFVTAVLGRITCEQLDRSTCAFAVSSNGLRCLLEKHVRWEGLGEEIYKCRTSGFKARLMAGLVETDACIAACSLDRKTAGISSDSLLDRRFMGRLCSPECFLNCPNIVDLYFNVAAGEGAFLPNLCRANGFRREISEKISYASGQKMASTPTAEINQINSNVDLSPTSAPKLNSHASKNPSSAPKLNSHASKNPSSAPKLNSHASKNPSSAPK